MRNWAIASDIKGFAFNSVFDISGPKAPHRKDLGNIVKRLTRRGRMLAVLEPGEEFKSEKPPLSFDAQSWSRNVLFAILALLLCSKKARRYKSVFLCRAASDDSDRELFKHRRCEVLGFEEAVAMIRDAGVDEKRLSQFYDLEYAHMYDITREQVYLIFISEVINEIEFRREGRRPNRFAVKEKASELTKAADDKDFFLLGMLEKPDKKLLSSRELLNNIDELSLITRQIYGNRNAETEKLLLDLGNAWFNAIPSCVRSYLDEHLEIEDASAVSIEDLVRGMLLEHAEEAYNAGVPMEDIIC